jgi:hypothetical protein
MHYDATSHACVQLRYACPFHLDMKADEQREELERDLDAIAVEQP